MKKFVMVIIISIIMFGTSFADSISINGEGQLVKVKKNHPVSTDMLALTLFYHCLLKDDNECLLNLYDKFVFMKDYNMVIEIIEINLLTQIVKAKVYDTDIIIYTLIPSCL